VAESVTLFVRPGDATCEAAQRYLDEKKVAYTTRDITKDPSASAVLFGKLGKIVVPTFLIGDRMIVGFDPVQLLRYLPKDESQEEHVAFGAAVRSLTPEVARAGGLNAAFGVEVGDVKEDSPAGQAGICKGDIITAIGAYTLTGGAQQFRTAIGAKRPGDNMTLTVWREGEEITVDVTFAVPAQA
jgi:glutaredoxin